MKTLAVALTLTISAVSMAHADATITIKGDERCITSDGVPNHSYGPFRARASLETQNHSFCVDATPIRTGTVTRNVQTSGVSLAGIPFRPGTAE
ncbi:MAG: hypothetical protein AAFP28_08590 [Pseudomonadota bacterium]